MAARLDRCTVIEGHAQFEGPDRVRVGGELLTARHIFIDVGGRAIVPDIPGIREVSYLTNNSIRALERVPEHLVAVGGSYVGLEFAQMYRRFRAGASSEVRLAIAESCRAVESAAPAPLPTTSPFFGRWAMGIAGQTTTYDTSGSNIIRTDSWTGARGGFLEIDPRARTSVSVGSALRVSARPVAGGDRRRSARRIRRHRPA